MNEYKQKYTLDELKDIKRTEAHRLEFIDSYEIKDEVWSFDTIVVTSKWISLHVPLDRDLYEQVRSTK